MGEPQKTIYAGQSVAPERTLALTKALLAEADRLKKGGRILRDKIGFIDCGVRWHSLLQECGLADSERIHETPHRLSACTPSSRPPITKHTEVTT